MRAAARMIVVAAAAAAGFDRKRLGALFAAVAAFPLFAPLASVFAVVATVVASEKIIKEHKTPPVVYVRVFEVCVLSTLYVRGGEVVKGLNIRDKK